MDGATDLAARRRAPAPSVTVSGAHREPRDSELAPLVLIADDAEDARDIYGEYFVYSGLRVATAVDGDHALGKVVSLMPDLVVMDQAP
jgi:hypothetical protein